MLYLLSPVSLTFNVNWNKYHTVFKRLSPIERRICELIGIEEDLIIAYGAGYGQSEMTFKREIAQREEDYASPVRLKVPSTGKTPLRHKLISQMTKFQAFADLNAELIKRQRHIRFYTTFLLKDLLSDPPLDKVCEYYSMSLGDIQAF